MDHTRRYGDLVDLVNEDNSILFRVLDYLFVVLLDLEEEVSDLAFVDGSKTGDKFSNGGFGANCLPVELRQNGALLRLEGEGKNSHLAIVPMTFSNISELVQPDFCLPIFGA